MELKTFKTNWPLRNPINILSCLTKTEKAIKGKYQKNLHLVSCMKICFIHPWLFLSR